MWKTLLPEVPRYLWLGKGYALDAVEMALMHEGRQRGFYNDIDGAIITGSYHNGPLTIIIPFGIWGAIGFGWFALAGFWVLYRNYRYGHEELRGVNTFLLAFYTMKMIFFVVFCGQIALDFFIFTGTLGLSVSLNRGVRAAAALPAVIPVDEAEAGTAPATA
jgi:hypothetical protein